jgi:hypothetical protein
MNWISVKEQLPELGIHVIVTDGVKSREAFFTKRNQTSPASFMFHGDILKSEITHWIPMPKPKDQFIQLTLAEISSGYNRVRWAEGLIKQLPASHEGRNSWLLNYGTDQESTEGVEPGEVCNRDGCKGIIESGRHGLDDSCSCHINPPCSHCTSTHCSICDYQTQA